MMYTYKKIFEEASKDRDSIPIHGAGYEAYLGQHHKIYRDLSTGKIRIVNTATAGNYYEPITAEAMKLFRQKGWRFATLYLSLSNYRLKLDYIEKAIHRQVNGSRNPKHLMSLQGSRDRIMELYLITIKKLSQYGNYENTI